MHLDRLRLPFTPHFTQAKARRGVKRTLTRRAPCRPRSLVRRGPITFVESVTCSPYIAVYQRPLQPVSALLLAACEPRPSLTASITSLPSLRILHRKHRTTAMSLVAEIKPEDHTSVEEMQEDKTAVQMKGGTYEDEREMSRMGKTQELRVCCLSCCSKSLVRY